MLYEATLYKVDEYGEMVGADALHPFYPAVMDNKIVEDIKKKGFMINAYTVNEEEDMKRLIELGIDGIITNYPDRLKKINNNATN